MLHPRSLILSLACLVTAAAAAGAEPRDVVRDLTCELVWEIPGDTEDYLLGGLLVGASWDRDGNLCVVDYRNADLKVFAPDGRWLRTLGRRGDGPGESRDARALLQAPDGRLGLLQIFPARVVWLNSDGSPAGITSFAETPDGSAGFVAMPHVIQHGDTFLAYITASALTAGTISEKHWIAPVLLAGGFGPPLYRREVDQPVPDAQGRLDEADYYDVWAARWAPDGAGGVWVAATRDTYRIDRYGPDGTALPPILRDSEPRERDDLGRRLAGERMQRKRLASNEVALRDTAPVVRSLRLAAGGDLWVILDLGGRGPASDTIAWVDVHAPDQNWIRQLRLSGPYEPGTDQWCFVDDRHILVLGMYDADEPVLRLLRLPPPGQ